MFSTIVCTPKWISSHYSQSEILVGGRFIIVFEYDYHRLIERLKHHISTFHGNDWNELAHKMSTFAVWEFEDYQE